MLVHESLHRAAQVARYWSEAGCPIVIHVDRRVSQEKYKILSGALSDRPNVRFSPRIRCEWGTWSLVSASQTASEILLAEFPEVRHVYLASGACIPLRPVADLVAYLNARPATDFIESATTEDVSWTKGGLDAERFQFSFPFSWKRQRFFFDRFVRLQRLVGYSRPVPEGLIPHLGSQWWCLTRKTLSAILEDPRRATFENYFRRVWIPDESYFQTMARRYAVRIESRTLTLSKFDYQGKPHVFYDDHLQLLRRSDCFVARKIWRRADRIYDSFLGGGMLSGEGAEPAPGKIDRVFAKAIEIRTRGRPGLLNQSRFPNESWENGKTAAPYSVLQGFDEVFQGFNTWASRLSEARIHGHLFAPDRAHFAGNLDSFAGALSDNATLRDYNPEGFLTNLIWSTRGERQSFAFGPSDRQRIVPFLAADANAHICVISGAWAVSLFHANRNFGEVRETAALLQKIEDAQLKILRRLDTRAKVHIWTLAEFMEAPVEALQVIIELLGDPTSRLTEAPHLVNLTGFGQFVQTLKNQGMHPHLVGDFPLDTVGGDARDVSKPRLVT
ncbi:MAG: beta-1,6-N-acetylglucosaminyltransferase [Pseudomonadota bacterium]